MILMFIKAKKKKKKSIYKLGNATFRNYFTTFLQTIDLTNFYLFLAQISGLAGVSPNFGNVCYI